MIASLRGTVLAVTGSTVIIEVAGVGYAVTVTPQQSLALLTGAEAFLRTVMIVREDEMSLFGFATVDELEVFDLLRSVTGVGPKSAIGVLAVMNPHAIATAIATEDDSAFRKVSGIGPKTAKLIVVSLAGKLLVTAPSGPAPRASSTVSQSVVVALVGLGWPERVAATAVDDALANATDASALSEAMLLRLALAGLGPGQLTGAGS